MNLKREFPSSNIYINGGITTINDIREFLEIYGGVMLGRKIYDDPMFLNEIEKYIFSSNKQLSTSEVINEYIDQLDIEDNKNKLYALKHLTNLFKGTCNAKVEKILHSMINSDQPLENIKNFIYRSNDEEKN